MKGCAPECLEVQGATVTWPPVSKVRKNHSWLMADFGEAGQESKRAIKSSRLRKPFMNDRLLPSNSLFTKVGQEAFTDPVKEN